MNHAHDFNWLLVRKVHDEIRLVALHYPEQLGSAQKIERAHPSQNLQKVNALW
jgi:hypothetical protein